MEPRDTATVHRVPLHVPLAEPPAKGGNSGPLELQVSFSRSVPQVAQDATPSNRIDAGQGNGSYFMGPATTSLQPNAEGHNRPGQELLSNEPIPSDDANQGALFIHPKAIDDLRRFRMLFVGLLLFIVSSTQGVHALFGVLKMQQQYGYTPRQMVNVYVCGTAFGMLVFPFGLLYDWFGPAVPVGLATCVTALGHLLLGLMFGGYIEQSVTKSCIFYSILCWGCYGLDVVVLPAVLTHMPRDRGQPTGLLKTFSGLGASFIACLFRGFFENNFENLMWFMLVLTVVIGVVGTCYLENAPYATSRWKLSRLTPSKKLQKHLIRNRYMSQLVPKRRYYIVSFILILLNFYLTIQAVCAAYLADQMTKTKYVGIAIGSIVLTLLTAIVIAPFRAIDGDTPFDEEVLKAAHQKEQELKAICERGDGETRADLEGDDQHTLNCNPLSSDDTERDKMSAERRSRSFTSALFSRQYEPAAPQRSVVEVFLQDLEGTQDGNSELPPQLQLSMAIPENDGLHQLATDDPPAPQNGASETNGVIPPPSQGDTTEFIPIQVTTRRQSTYAEPRVEVINLCGEVFVTPVYETTFLQSLTYLDIWMIFFTTMIVWGIGIALTANFVISIMVLARNKDMDYKLYILFSAMAGVSTAGGRVFLGIYEQVLKVLRARFGIVLVSTFGYPLASIGLFISMVLWIALPGNKTLIIVYLLGPAFYGISTSMTMYVLGTVFDRDLGMHYSFCFFGAAIGVVLFFRLLFYETYNDYLLPDIVFIPNVGPIPNPFKGFCIGQRRCMNKAVGGYIVLTFVSIFTSYYVHYRYQRLVQGKLLHRRVIAPALSRVVRSVKARRSRETKEEERPRAHNESSSTSTEVLSEVVVALSTPLSSAPVV